MSATLRRATCGMLLTGVCGLLLSTAALAASNSKNIQTSPSGQFIDNGILPDYTEQQAYHEILSWASGSTKPEYLQELYERIELSAFRYGWEPEFAVALVCAEARYGNQISWARRDVWLTYQNLTDTQMRNLPNVFDDVNQALSELAHIARSGGNKEALLKTYWTGPDSSYNTETFPGFYDAVGKLYSALKKYSDVGDAAQDAKKYRQQQGTIGNSSWGRLALGDMESYSSRLNAMPKLASQLKSFGEHDVNYAKIVQHFNSKLSDAEAIVIARAVLTYCEQTGNIVDPRLVMSVVAAESRFRPEAVSKAGAMGLGQLMPGTARGLGIRDAFDPIQNLYGCVKYLEREMVRWGDNSNYIDLVLASYNAGPGAVKKYGGVPPYKETQGYVRTVKGYYKQLTK